MATVSSHILNSVLGTHAGGIRVELFRLADGGAKERLFDTKSDEGGRVSETVGLDESEAQYELVFHTGPYFAAQPIAPEGMQIMREVVVRLAMPDPDARYHIPMMLSPHSYSIWWSS